MGLDGRFRCSDRLATSLCGRFGGWSGIHRTLYLGSSNIRAPSNRVKFRLVPSNGILGDLANDMGRVWIVDDPVRHVDLALELRRFLDHFIGGLRVYPRRFLGLSPDRFG